MAGLPAGHRSAQGGSRFNTPNHLRQKASRMIRTAFLAALALAALAPNAEARQRHKSGLHKDCNVLFPCTAPYASTPDQVLTARGRYVASQVGFGGPVVRRAARAPKARPEASYGVPVAVQRVAAAVVAHPPGCPARAFCGCGAAVRVFGAPVRSLWLAANWFKFPRAAPAAGMVAVRRGHVFVLERHLGGSTWLAYDANSGRRQTRIHPRSIAGYAIVNPHGSG